MELQTQAGSNPRPHFTVVSAATCQGVPGDLYRDVGSLSCHCPMGSPVLRQHLSVTDVIAAKLGQGVVGWEPVLLLASCRTATGPCGQVQVWLLLPSRGHKAPLPCLLLPCHSALARAPGPVICDRPSTPTSHTQCEGQHGPPDSFAAHTTPTHSRSLSPSHSDAATCEGLLCAKHKHLFCDP